MEGIASASAPVLLVAAGDPDQVARSFDGLEIIRVRGAQGPRPQMRRCEAGDFPFVCVFAVEGGALIRAAGDAVVIEGGQLVIVRNEPTLVLSAARESDLLVAYLPKAPTAPYANLFDEQAGMRWDGRNGSASLAVSFLRTFVRQFDSYRTGHPARFAVTLVGLLGLMCVDGGPASSTPADDAALDSVRSFIEANLADTNLSPELIASAQHVSTRTLHRLFERRGSTISAWIRHERLERCRMDLTDPRLAHLRVNEIGGRWGLWNAAHFSRLFKQAYGMSPRQYRRAHTGASMAAPATLREIA